MTRRIRDAYGTTTAYEHRDTIIEKQYFANGPSLFTWVISGFGPDGWSEWNTLREAKRYIDRVKDES